jgi:coat protein Gp5
MSTITSANLANAIVKLVAADALSALVGNLVMGNLVNRDYEPVLAHSGDTVNVPIPPVLVANNIAEGGTITPQNPSIGNAQIVLNTHAEASFQIPDVTKALAYPELLKAYMQPAVIAIAERIETDLLGLYGQFTANTPVGYRQFTFDRSNNRCGRNRFVHSESSRQCTEVLSGRFEYLFADSADSSFQRILLFW